MHCSFNSPARQSRRQAQLAQLDIVSALPERAQGGALYALWPYKLPKTVRSRISSTVRAQWRAARHLATESRIQRQLAELERMDAEMDAMLDHVKSQEIYDHLREMHGDQAERLVQVITSVANLKAITVALGNGLTRQFNLDEEDDYQEELMTGVCLAMEMGAGITLRQSLALRVQVPNTQGQMEWRAQERVYGFSCGEGRWTALTAADMRRAYQHDQDGNPMEADPGTSFGNAKDLARGVR